MLVEELLIYGICLLLVIAILAIYVWRKTAISKKNEARIMFAKEEGIHEPDSLYPFIDPDICIGVS